MRITSVKVEKGVHATKSTDNMFYELSFATSMDLSGLDTTGVTSMDWMLADCQMLECLDISSLDNSLVGSEGSVVPPEMHGYTFLGTGNRLQFIKIGEKWDASKAFPYGVNSSRIWSARLQSWVDLHQSSDISGHADTFTTYRSFQDVSYTHWARGVISRAADMSIISGYSGGRFGPDDRIKRGQVAAILWNMAGKPAAGRGARSFPDVKSSAYYYDAVRWASSVGVVSGYASGRFGPEDLVTREQFSAMLANYSSNVAGRGASGSKADFAVMIDASSVSPWARASVGWCFRSGIMSGKSGARIDPQGNATRAEAAKMVVYLHDMLL